MRVPYQRQGRPGRLLRNRRDAIQAGEALSMSQFAGK